jgi:hypothetical protein
MEAAIVGALACVADRLDLTSAGADPAKRALERFSPACDAFVIRVELKSV